MEANILILGGGVAGLIAARHCEEAGYAPVLLEAAPEVGGRVRTDYQDGYQFDHGFQVLLTEYHEAQRYLNFAQLDLHHFSTGALIFDQKGKFTVADPLREPGKLLPMAFSRVGSLRDKWLVWKLANELKQTDREQTFAGYDQSTLTYLRDYGFSQRMIQQFFQPFFGGIFLENELSTPAGMFRFVFKMFSQGTAALPRTGIGAITQQLRAALRKTDIQTGIEIKQIKDNNLIDANGRSHPFDKLILATDPAPLMDNMPGQEIQWQQTCNLYYTADRPLIDAPTIGLISQPDSLINNFCVLTKVWPDYAPPGKHLISVTLKKIPSDSSELHRALGEELMDLCKVPEANIAFLRRYDIRQALPVNPTQRYTMQASACSLTDDIYLAGDYLLNASLDAAMRSGRLATEAMLQSL